MSEDAEDFVALRRGVRYDEWTPWYRVKSGSEIHLLCCGYQADVWLYARMPNSPDLYRLRVSRVSLKALYEALHSCALWCRSRDRIEFYAMPDSKEPPTDLSA